MLVERAGSHRILPCRSLFAAKEAWQPLASYLAKLFYNLLGMFCTEQLTRYDFAQLKSKQTAWNSCRVNGRTLNQINCCLLESWCFGKLSLLPVSVLRSPAYVGRTCSCRPAGVMEVPSSLRVASVDRYLSMSTRRLREDHHRGDVLELHFVSL